MLLAPRPNNLNLTTRQTPLGKEMCLNALNEQTACLTCNTLDGATARTKHARALKVATDYLIHHPHCKWPELGVFLCLTCNTQDYDVAPNINLHLRRHR